MSFTVFRRELRMQRSSFAIWTLVLLALAALYLSVYPAFAKDAAIVTEVFAKLPPAVRIAMGTGGFKLFSFPGFIANILPIFLLAGGIQAMNMGITMTNRERLSHTSDFLLTKPVSRDRVFLQKLSAHLLLIVVLGVILSMALYAGAKFVDSAAFSGRTFLMIMAVFTGVQLWFFAVGLLLSQLIGRIRAAIGISIAVVFGLFILAIFSSVVGDEMMRWLTPFKYVDLLEVVKSQTYSLGHIMLWVVIVVVGIVGSWVIYRRKDVTL